MRDISAEEIAFLVEAFEYEGVLLHEGIDQSEVLGNVFRIAPRSKAALNVTGLQSLGVLGPPETGWDGGTMRFTSIAAKVIALIAK